MKQNHWGVKYIILCASQNQIVIYWVARKEK